MSNSDRAISAEHHLNVFEMKEDGKPRLEVVSQKKYDSPLLEYGICHVFFSISGNCLVFLVFMNFVNKNERQQIGTQQFNVKYVVLAG